MRTVLLGGLILLSLGLTGCDSSWAPPQAISATPGPEGSPAAAGPAAAPRPSSTAPARRRYQGRTAEEWAASLSSRELEEIHMAARALHILGLEGRPHLFQGLQNPSPHTRRVCLESLAVSDFRAQGEAGRRLLVQLAGDRADVRIRERASRYLSQWDRTIPTP